MTKYFNIDEHTLEQMNSTHTAREISQQPKMWEQTCREYRDRKEDIDRFLQPLLSKNNLRIILTGAGTSAFAGQALAPWLSQMVPHRIEAVSTTNITGAPHQHFNEQCPTLLVSFARSGNSPESVAAVQIADELLQECYHLVLTCNPEGALARQSGSAENMLTVLMPEGTNDQSLVMTSSFSSMVVAALCIFSGNVAVEESIKAAAVSAEKVLSDHLPAIREIAQSQYNRLVYLGAGGLQGIAQEAALKSIEMSDGQIVCLHDSPLGFRHGPKSVVDGETVVVLFMSNDQYTRRYDNDLLAELRRDNKAKKIVPLNADFFSINNEMMDAGLGLVYLVFAQILAFFRSTDMGFAADNPCPTGEINRVVQGVTIYPLQNQ